MILGLIFFVHQWVPLLNFLPCLRVVVLSFFRCGGGGVDHVTNAFSFLFVAYTVQNLYCFFSGPMYHPFASWGYNEVHFPDSSCIVKFFLLYSKWLFYCALGESFGLIIGSRSSLKFFLGDPSWYQRCSVKSGSFPNKTRKKVILYVRMALSEVFCQWIWVGTNFRSILSASILSLNICGHLLSIFRSFGPKPIFVRTVWIFL